MTTTPGKLTMIGLGAQALMLRSGIRSCAVASIVLGALLSLLFRDLDNWMRLMLAGFLPVRSALLQEER